MNYLGEITAIRETEEGTDVIVHVPELYLGNKISKYKNKGKIDVDLMIDDQRRITNSQRRKIFAMIKDIANFMGEPREWARDYWTSEFCKESGIEYFSLSRRSEKSASIDVARSFITYLIDLAYKENIPTVDTMLERTDDIDAYLYLCIKYRKCALCQEKAHIHHIDTIGMGRDRDKVDDKEHRKIALCPVHHGEAHWIGVDSFSKKYHVYGILVDQSKDFKEWYEI